MMHTRVAMEKLGRRMTATPVAQAWQPIDVAELRARVEAALHRRES